MKLYVNDVNNLYEQDVEIEVKHEGILEVPEGKNVDDLPMSHFEKLAKKKGLGKITKALNNLQVWNKKKDPKLSKWAGNMIDKLNKKLKKDEAYNSGIETGWKERTIAVDDDEQEAAVEEILAYAKRDNDRIEWDIDYNGGAFADSRVFYIYSDGDTFEEIRYKVREMKDDAIYGRGVYESIKENRYGYVHDEEEAKLPSGIRSYLNRTGWIPVNIDGKRYFEMDFNYGNLFCTIYIDEWGNCYLTTDNYDLSPNDMFYTITETDTGVIDDLITLGNTITSTGDVDSAMSAFFG